MQISRVTRSKSAARKAYDRLSQVYNQLAGSSEWRYIQLGLEQLAITPGETVLEIGCGTGTALEVLCRQVGDHGLVCGLDLSPGMLQVADARLAKNRQGKIAQLSCGDGVALPYPTASFTSVFMSFTLELFDTPEIPMVLAECQRVLMPGGRLGVVAMLKSNRTSWIVQLYEWFHARLPTYVDCRPIDVEPRIQAAGFDIAKLQVHSMWGLPVELIVARKC